MNVRNNETAQAQPEDRESTHFRLYIAEGTPNSVRAMANLKSVCQEYLHGRHKVEVVDILQEPLRALSEGVLVTPTLVRLSPLPVRKIVGDLSDTATVLQALGLEGGAK
jgi:circadian clock protein KaiB